MVPVKAGRSKHSGLETRPALSRSPARAGGQIGSFTGCESAGEQELLEQIRKVCLECCQSYASQVTISSHQTVPPQAVSLMDPPERAWLIRLHIVGYGEEQAIGEGEVIAVMRGSEVSIVLR